jgi:tetratricopeptide (TPR) repeat protein
MLPPAVKDIPQLYQQALALQKAGRDADALTAFRRILMARPNTPEALFQIGRIETAAGNLTEAEANLRKALALKPREAAIWQALHTVLTGTAARRLSRDAAKAGVVLGTETEAKAIAALIPRDAAKAETRALAFVKAAPHAFWPALTLGQVRMAQQNWRGAFGPLDMAHKRDPAHVGAMTALGICAARLDLPVRAEALLKPLGAGATDAALALAESYRGSLRLDEATALLAQIKPTGPHARRLHRDRAQVLALSGQGGDARRAAAAAIKSGASPVAMAHDLAAALQEAGDIPGATRALADAIKDHPQDASLRTHLAQFMQSAGDLPAAEAELHAALDLDDGYAEAYRAYMAGRKIGADDPVFARMQSHLGRPDLDQSARRILNFAAAKALGDLGRPADAFAHLDRANRLTAQAYPYDFKADLAEARALVADWGRLQSLSCAASPQDPVLFVTGLPRSGTTLVESILAAHSTVAAGGELPFLSRAMKPAMETLRAGAPDAQAFADAGARYLKTARRRTGAALFTDKAISTFSRVGHTLCALPAARIVILRRDPRDVGLSLYRNRFPDGLHRYANDLTSIGRYIRLHDAMVAFWADRVPDRVHIVDYEALTADPEPAIRALVAFAGLDWEQACLHPERAERRVETLSFASVRQPIGRGAVAGWRAFETDLQPMLRALDDTSIDLSADAPPA